MVNVDGLRRVIHHFKAIENALRMVYDTSESAQNCLRNMRMTVGEYDNDTSKVKWTNLHGLG